METASKVLAVTLGGACGVNARFWLSLLIARWLGVRFPWATFAINVSGSFGIGLVAVAVTERWTDPLVRIGVITGFLGGYTTFSSYMFESFTLWERGNRTLAVGNVVGSIFAGMLAVILGAALGRWLFEPMQHGPAAAQVEQSLKMIAESESGQEPPDRAVG